MINILFFQKIEKKKGRELEKLRENIKLAVEVRANDASWRVIEEEGEEKWKSSGSLSL